MATTKRELSQRINSAGKSEIIIRVSICRGNQSRLKSGLFINPDRFKNGTITKPRANPDEAAELRRIDADLSAMEQYILDICAATPKEIINKSYLTERLEGYRFPSLRQDTSTAAFTTIFENFITSHTLSESRVKHYRTLIGALERYEIYRNADSRTPYKLELDSFGSVELNGFETFLRTEKSICDKYPKLYEEYFSLFGDGRKIPRPTLRGDNTISGLLKCLRAFFNWSVSQGLIESSPFRKYSGTLTEKYGTPYYLTTEERDRIADYDLSGHPALEAQRDIFIFQCLIGCRVSDLLRMTPENIIDGAVEYIAEKTINENPQIIRVPLHPRATELIKKYAGREDGLLFPFITSQRYNDAIKKIFTAAGITRAVTILNPVTGKEEKRPLNEIASSHIARRTFVGNLYRKVKDPNLVGSLSGHKEGSKAFARYRDIDEEMKKELVALL